MSIGQRGLRRLAPAGLVFLTLLAYLPALGNGFVWDDDEYVTHSHFIRDLDGLRRSWTEPAATLTVEDLNETQVDRHAKWRRMQVTATLRDFVL